MPGYAADWGHNVQYTDSGGVVDPGERSQITEYAWDYRKRLVGVINRDAEGGPAAIAVQYVRDDISMPSLREGMPPAAAQPDTRTLTQLQKATWHR